MEVFIWSVDWTTTGHEVTRSIANVIHQDPAYSPTQNFHVQLFKDRRQGRQHSGRGRITFPTLEVATQFLRDFGEGSRSGRRIFIGRSSRPLRCKPSHRNGSVAQTDILAKISGTPYIDPAEEERQERLSEQLQKTLLPVQQIQFGWNCRDYCFSVEWEHSARAHLSFDYDARKILVSIPKVSNPAAHSSPPSFGAPSIFTDLFGESSAAGLTNNFSDAFALLTPGSIVLAIDYNQVASVNETKSTGGDTTVFISLSSPPMYLSRPAEIALFMDKKPMGKRLVALPLKDMSGRPHEDVARYLSLDIRLVCPRGSTTFEELADKGELNIYIQHEDYPIVRRGLFAPQVLQNFDLWIRDLPFHVAYQIDGLIRDLKADPKEMLEIRRDVDTLVRSAEGHGLPGVDYLTRVFRDFGTEAYELFSHDADTEKLRRCLRKVKDRQDRRSSSTLLSQRTDEGLFLCYHVMVTPTGIFLDGPSPERSNRVIRLYPAQFHPNFIRVSFVDEGKLKIRIDKAIDQEDYVRGRVGKFLLNGLRVAGRQFEYLAYSQSSLKEHSVWFLRPFTHARHRVDAAHIIRSLGSFADLPSDPRLMFCPARYAARISQGFTTTDPTTTEVETIRTDLPDIISYEREAQRSWNHTDGVGTMSPEFAKSISAERQRGKKGRRRRLADYPRAVQIRFMGSKGMLSVDYTLTGKTICLRPSMNKFAGAPSNRIEIAKVFDRPGMLYLNRPLIVVLEDLGVPFESFKKHQDIAKDEVYSAKESLAQAAGLFEHHGLGSAFRLPSVLLNLVKLGASMPNDDSFYSRLLEYSINHVLRLIKHKARIPVYGGYNLVGIADVHRFLGPGEVFICVNKYDGSGPKYLEGDVVISRSPVIHPGDVQVARAIGSPPKGSCFAIEPLPNTLVFNTTDVRPMSTRLGGGDLDGDEYNVIELAKLPEFRPTRTFPASLYDPAPRKELDRPCNQEDVANFIVEYILSDVLGYVSINWRIIADQEFENKGIFDERCLKLADLHSLAVDYPKSGRPVPLVDIPKRNDQFLPDWYAPETASAEADPSSQPRYYPSQRAIGRLFREVELPASVPGQAAARGRRQRARYNRERDAEDDEDDDLDDLATMFDHLHLNSRDHWKSWGSRLDDRHSICAVVKSRVWEFIDVSQPVVENNAASHIRHLFYHYRSELQNICGTHSLSQKRSAMLSEEEAVVGTIVANTSQPRKRLDYIAKVREATTTLAQGVRRSLTMEDDVNADEQGDNEDEEDEEEDEEEDDDEEKEHMDNLRRGWFAWVFSLAHAQDEMFGAQSFGWIALGVIFDSIKNIEGYREYVAREGIVRNSRWR